MKHGLSNSNLKSSCLWDSHRMFGAIALSCARSLARGRKSCGKMTRQKMATSCLVQSLSTCLGRVYIEEYYKVSKNKFTWVANQILKNTTEKCRKCTSVARTAFAALDGRLNDIDNNRIILVNHRASFQKRIVLHVLFTGGNGRWQIHLNNQFTCAISWKNKIKLEYNLLQHAQSFNFYPKTRTIVVSFGHTLVASSSKRQVLGCLGRHP
jgi:hypothetical protein